MTQRDQTADGYDLELFPVLTRRPRFGGAAPRQIGILTLTTSLALSVAFGLVWLVLPLGLVFHGITVYLTHNDEWWLETLRRHLAQPDYFAC